MCRASCSLFSARTAEKSKCDDKRQPSLAGDRLKHYANRKNTVSYGRARARFDKVPFLPGRRFPLPEALI